MILLDFPPTPAPVIERDRDEREKLAAASSGEHAATLISQRREASAADSLARCLYACRCSAYGVPYAAWEDVAFHVQQGFLEVAIRTLRAVDPQRGDVAARLYALGTALAQQESRR